MFTVLPLDSGQCFICLASVQVHIIIARPPAEMAAETSCGPNDIDIK